MSDKASNDKRENAPTPIGVNLIPAGQSIAPTLVNYAQVHPAGGLVMLDAAYLDPRHLAKIAKNAAEGKAPPKEIREPLAVRLAMSPEAAAQLYRQLGTLLQGAKSRTGEAKKPIVN